MAKKKRGKKGKKKGEPTLHATSDVKPKRELLDLDALVSDGDEDAEAGEATHPSGGEEITPGATAYIDGGKPTKTLTLDAIRPRAHGDIRSLDKVDELLELAESIAVLGLIQAPTVDCEDRLLAGRRRLAAIEILTTPTEARGRKLLDLCPGATPMQMMRAQELPDEYDVDAGAIPIRVLGFDSKTGFERAVLSELAENEKREGFTTADIRALIKRLEDKGYRWKRGRPKKGQKPAGPLLEVAIGISRTHIWRKLREDDGEEKVTHVTISDEQKAAAAEKRDREKLITALDRYLSKHASTTALGSHTLRVLRKAIVAMREL